MTGTGSTTNYGDDYTWATDPAYEAFLAEQDAHYERACGADYSTGGFDPYGTTCDLDRGHAGPHEGADPFGRDEPLRWTGGGTCAGDRLPAHVVTA